MFDVVVLDDELETCFGLFLRIMTAHPQVAAKAAFGENVMAWETSLEEGSMYSIFKKEEEYQFTFVGIAQFEEVIVGEEISE